MTHDDAVRLHVVHIDDGLMAGDAVTAQHTPHQSPGQSRCRRSVGRSVGRLLATHAVQMMVFTSSSGALASAAAGSLPEDPPKPKGER